MAYQSKYSRERQKLIASYEDQKVRRIKAIQRAFKLSVTSYLLSNLDIKNDSLKSTAANFAVLASIGNARDAFYNVTVMPFLRWAARSANKLLSSNNRYYKNASDDLKKSVQRNAHKWLGITNGDNIRKGGFLEAVGDVSRHFNDVKALAVQTVADGAPVKALSQTINIYTGSNRLEKDINERSADLFPRVDRDAGDRFRNALGLRYAIWQGGIIKTSRPICKTLNNRVLSIDELAQLRDIDFQGKSNPYNPYKDCGGYNCRHQLDWISDELAKELRDDLDNFIRYVE